MRSLRILVRLIFLWGLLSGLGATMVTLNSCPAALSYIHSAAREVQQFVGSFRSQQQVPGSSLPAVPSVPSQPADAVPSTPSQGAEAVTRLNREATEKDTQISTLQAENRSLAERVRQLERASAKPPREVTLGRILLQPGQSVVLPGGLGEMSLRRVEAERKSCSIHVTNATDEWTYQFGVKMEIHNALVSPQNLRAYVTALSSRGGGVEFLIEQP